MKKLAHSWWVPLFWLLLPARVFASTGGGLEWEAPLTKVSDSIKGPVAFAICLLAIVACGCALAFGGEIGEFVRRLVMLVLIISVIVFAAQILQSLFGTAALL